MRSKSLLIASAILCASNVSAGADSWSTQIFCLNDYYAYCSNYTAGSAEGHACMRANRSKLLNSCESALVDDGILPTAEAAPKKAKIAVAAPKKVKPAPRSTVKPTVTKLKNPPAKVGAMAPAEKEAPPAKTAPPSGHLETTAAKPAPLASAHAAPPAIDQQTFEALKNRAPSFLVQEDLASMFARAHEDAPRQPAAASR